MSSLKVSNAECTFSLYASFNVALDSICKFVVVKQADVFGWLLLGFVLHGYSLTE